MGEILSPSWEEPQTPFLDFEQHLILNKQGFDLGNRLLDLAVPLGLLRIPGIQVQQPLWLALLSDDPLEKWYLGPLVDLLVYLENVLLGFLHSRVEVQRGDSQAH